MSNESADSRTTETAPVPNQVRHENAPGAISDNTGNIATGGSATVHDRLGVYLAVLALIIATLALGMVIMLPAQQAARVDMLADRAAKAEREARVMEERWNDLKVELAKKGIPVSDH